MIDTIFTTLIFFIQSGAKKQQKQKQNKKQTNKQKNKKTNKTKQIITIDLNDAGNPCRLKLFRVFKRI